MNRLAVISTAVVLTIVIATFGAAGAFAWGGPAQNNGQGGFGGCIGGPGGTMHNTLEQAAAETLGVSVQDIENGLRDGKTIAEQAQEKNVDATKIIDAFRVKEQARLSQLVTDGVLTQEQADSLLEWHVDRAGFMIEGGYGRGMMGGRGGFGGCGMNGGYGPGWNNDNNANWNGRGMMGGNVMMGYWN